MTLHKLCQAACGLAVFLSLAGSALAGSFVVNPVRVTLSAAQPVGAITVRNNGQEPTVVQLDTSSWAQQDGATVLNPTNEILATPPIFTLQPGGSQIVRVGLRRTPEQDHELTYRLFLREVPQGKPDSQSLRVALHISLPVFVASKADAAPKIVWRVIQTPDGSIEVSAQNVGSAHVQVADITLSRVENGALIAKQQLAEYVLPGNTRSWRVKSEAALTPGTQVRILAQTDAGEMPTQVALENAALQTGADTQAMAD